MFSFLLVIIYLSFISLGLPDSLLGSAWPVMVDEFSAPLSYAGIISTIISAGTIVSSLLSDRLTRKFGAGLVTAVSVFTTALALFGFSVSKSVVMLCIIAVPYGLGAGAVDAALNNYVALHYTSRHMNWLHCFWGLGATLGPYIMGWAISTSKGWRMGYSSVFIIQILLSLVLFLSLPLWKKRVDDAENSQITGESIGIRGAIKIKGVKEVLLAFFGYCSLEATAILWASSYLVDFKKVDVQTAARFASLYCLGITAGRFVCGFISNKIGDKNMIRIGTAVTFVGLLLIMLPIKTAAPSLAGLVIMGIGSAPIYPSIIHSTPEHFGKQNSQAIVGIQMASAYVGCTLMPPFFGLIAQYISISLFPFYMAFFAVLMLLMAERVNKLCKEIK